MANKSEKKKMSKQSFNEMEYLIKELVKEWEQSKEIKFVKEIEYKDAKILMFQVLDKVYILDALMEQEDLSFRQSIKKTKESYVLLRLLGKLKSATEKLETAYGTKDINDCVVISMDKAEYKQYRECQISSAN